MKEFEFITGDSFIDGNWEAGNGAHFESVNPLDNSSNFKLRGIDGIQLKRAVCSAEKGYFKFRKFSSKQIGNLFKCIGEELQKDEKLIIEVCHAETGLSFERLEIEKNRTVFQLNMFAEILISGNWQEPSIDLALPERKPLMKPDIRSALSPIGPVVVFSASNFPLAFSILGGDTISALSSGNSVIIKAHPGHPATSELCFKILVRCLKHNNMPLMALSLIQSADNSIAEELVANLKVKAVAFTGSTKVGKILHNIGCNREEPIQVFAEMGSTNPVFILSDALKHNGTSIAKGLAQSILMGYGQLCTKPGLIFLINDSGYNEFIDNLTIELYKHSKGVFLNRKIKEDFIDKYLLLCNDKRLKRLCGNGITVPCLFSIKGVDYLHFKDLEEEVFGPMAIIVECNDLTEMEMLASELHGHLTASVHSHKDDNPAELICLLEQMVGRIVFNGFTTGVEVCTSMHHGGPFPASFYPLFTSVGPASIKRFCKTICYQNFPQVLLPEILQNENKERKIRLVNGMYTNGFIK